MPTLKLLQSGSGKSDSSGEVFSCAYAPDGGFVLSAGWDGHLRLWEPASGAHIKAIRASEKPLSACALSPDGKRFLSGSMDGLVCVWDSVSHTRLTTWMAHTYPVSAMLFSADGQRLFTSSWDRSIIIWNLARDREKTILAGHTDGVAGYRLTAEGSKLLSWSFDGALRMWDLKEHRSLFTLVGHKDRVTAGALSPDGLWAASGSRDQSLKLWNLQTRQEIKSVQLAGEVRACFFMLDGESLAAVDSTGRLTLHSLPNLEQGAEVSLGVAVHSANLAPLGNQIALGADDGRVHFVTVEGCESLPLLVTPTQTTRHTGSRLQRIFGKGAVTHAYSCTCPACRHAFEVPSENQHKPAPCPKCKRPLRFNITTRVLQPK